MNYLLSVKRMITWTIFFGLLEFRLPDERSYVIRDILSFWKDRGKKSYYQIGKAIMNQFCFEEFDEADRELLTFYRVVKGVGKESI